MQQTDRIAELVRRAEALPDPAARSLMVELLRAVMEFHAEGLDRLMELACADNAACDKFLSAVARDEAAAGMLLLHGLHPQDTATRVLHAVERLSVSFERRGGSLSLASVEGAEVRVRFRSTRPWTGASLQGLVEEAILGAAPEIESVVVDGAEASSASFVPLASLTAGLRP